MKNRGVLKFEFRKAGPADLAVLLEMRKEVVKAVFSLDEDMDMSDVERESHKYYMQSFADGSHAAYIAYDGDRIAGCGGICFYRVMPSVGNLSGLCACIMNMYTRPEYRGRGIAFETVRLLVAEAKSRGVVKITLETTDAGRALYRRSGFTEQKDEMELIVSQE